MKSATAERFGGKNTSFIRIGIALLAVLIVSLSVSRLVYPFGVGAWESFNWMPATHLLEGKNPYAFAFTPPYGMSPYGIVYYALVAVGVELFGYQIWFGRILSLLAFVVCVWSVVKIAGKSARGRDAVWMAALAALAMFPAQIWISMMRCDLPAAAFAFSALALVFAFEEKEKIPVRRVAWVILLASAAFFTKQTYLLPTAIIFLRFLQMKKWREALIFAVGFNLLMIGGIYALNETSSGGYVWQHFTHAQRLPYEFLKCVRVFLEMLKQPTFFFSLVFLLVFAFQNRRFFKSLNRFQISETARSRKFLVFAYLLISLGWSFASSGRIGAGPNYFIENSFILAVAVGLIYEHFKRNAAPSLALAMIVLLTGGGAFQLARVLRGEYFRWRSLGYYQEIYATIGKLATPESRCISVYPELVVWNGCQFNFDDFEEYMSNWSPELAEIFEREIRAQRFAAIVWLDDDFEKRFPEYRLLKMSQSLPEKYYRVYLYVPVEPSPKNDGNAEF